MTKPAPRPLRVLIIEDEPVIAMAVESSIEQLGHLVIGPFARLDQALTVAATDGYDCAIVDINVLGGPSYAVADILIKKQRPFILASGSSYGVLPEYLRDHLRLVKPFSLKQLEESLVALINNCRGTLDPDLAK